MPRHWWHWVQCLEPSVSVNHWVHADGDDTARQSEAVVRYVVSTLGRSLPDALNPGEALGPQEDEDAVIASVLGIAPSRLPEAVVRALTHPQVADLVASLVTAYADDTLG